MPALDRSLLVVLGGTAAALHVGKLAPALPALQASLGLGLVEAGFLLSLVQLAGMAAGLVVGLAADAIGLKRTMVLGLGIVSIASVLGGWTRTGHGLLALRALEGVGFLLASMPAPALIRRLVAPSRLAFSLGLWGTFMPAGTGLALLVGPPLIAIAGWPAWWWLLGALSFALAAWIGLALPPDPPRADARPGAGWGGRLVQTLGARGPWLVAFAFAAYSAQWLAVIGFLPSICAQAGLAGTGVALAMAAAAAVNVLGNIGAGRLLQRRWPPQRLLRIGYAVMGLGALVAFSPVWPDALGDAALAGRYAGVLVFSAVGGLVPATLFSLAVRLAPGEATVSTTVGWMQQWSAFGQFAGPPLVAWAAVRAGGWQWSGAMTGACAVAGLALTLPIARLLNTGAKGRT